MGPNALLIWVVCLVAGTASLLWGAMAWPLRVAPLASRRFALGNVLFFLSLVASQQRGAESSWLAWPLSDLLGIAAFILLRSGVQALFAMPTTRRSDALLYGGFVLAYGMQAPNVDSTWVYTLLYSMAVALFAGRLVGHVYRAAQREFAPGAGLVLALPFALLTGVMLVRMATLGWPPTPGAPPQDGAATLWSFVLLSLLMNLSLVGCVVARLVILVRHQADTDALTGLPNRRAAEERLRLEVAREQRHPHGGFVLALLDLDHFKRLNDGWGHDAGDAALRHVAAVWLPQLRREDLLARWGGEEFLLLLPESASEQGRQTAERLRAALEAQPLPWQGQTLPLTVSLGLCHVGGGDAATALRAADQALYRAKAGGRNRVEMA